MFKMETLSPANHSNLSPAKVTKLFSSLAGNISTVLNAALYFADVRDWIYKGWIAKAVENLLRFYKLNANRAIMVLRLDFRHTRLLVISFVRFSYPYMGLFNTQYADLTKKCQRNFFDKNLIWRSLCNKYLFKQQFIKKTDLLMKRC